jgi:hypothetical protein
VHSDARIVQAGVTGAVAPVAQAHVVRRIAMRGAHWLAVLAIGCGPPPREEGAGGGNGNGTDSGTNADGCADGTELIYTIDQFNKRLSRFDPASKTFFDLGTLSCAAMVGATPFSMSVDRQANAWVLFTSGELFKVGVADLACTKLAWSSPNGLKVFGMGFSTDMPGGSAEALYVGGGATQIQSSFTLARVDPATMTATTIGTQPQLPEMTGNGKAELWGFMPAATSARVVQFDKTSGAIVKTFDQPTLGGDMSGYAFAHWGGDYWVFLIRPTDASTIVYQVSGMTGAITSTTPTTGRTIVGAGVSTCAPVVIL